MTKAPVIGGEEGFAVFDFFGVQLRRREAFHREAIDFGKGFFQCFRKSSNSDRGIEIREIHHTGRHGGDALCMQLRARGVEVLHHVLHVFGNQNGAVMVAAAAGLVEGIPGKFPSVAVQIIPPRHFDGKPKALRRFANDGDLFLHIIERFRCAEGEIQIAKIVIHRTTAGKPPR